MKQKNRSQSPRAGLGEIGRGEAYWLPILDPEAGK
jgi:hypothetical protein